jgi:AraC-like DNA-binding protein
MIMSRPLEISVPSTGVYFAESVHARDFAMPERADEFHKLVFVQRGRIELRTRAGKKSVEIMGPERALLPIPAGVRHQIVDQEPSVILVLALGDAFLRRDPDVWEIWERLQVHPVSGRVMVGGFAGWWRRAVLEQTLRGPGAGVTVRAMALQVLVAADRHVTRPLADSTKERVRAVQRTVKETFFEDWTIDRAAQRAGLSRRQFTLRFKEVSGQTFVAYLNGLRLAHAERLLGSGGHSVTGAAFSAGFEDLSHFYRLFRGKHGLPPRRWLQVPR